MMMVVVAVMVLMVKVVVVIMMVVVAVMVGLQMTSLLLKHFISGRHQLHFGDP